MRAGTLNIGLIGSGFMGQAHADAFRRAGMLYRDLPARPHLYMLADANDSLAADAASRFGFERSTGDWRALVSDPAVDIVDITSPNAMHRETALAACAPDGVMPMPPSFPSPSPKAPASAGAPADVSAAEPPWPAPPAEGGDPAFDEVSGEETPTRPPIAKVSGGGANALAAP